MFEIGRTYKLYISEGSEEEGITEHWNCRAIAVEMPVVKFDRGGKELIANVSSKAFVKAERQGD